MRERRRHAGVAFFAGALALGLWRDDSWASGFQLREEGAEALGNAYAGSTAKAYDLSTLFYNPAGMVRLSGNQAGATAAWVSPDFKFSGSDTVAGRAVSGGSGGNSIKPVAVGSAYLLWDAAPDLKAGLAVTTPFGMRSEYKEDWVGRYQALATDLTVVNVSPSVAYRLNNALSVAGGLQVSWAKTSLTNAVNFNALVPGSGDGLARIGGEDTALGWTTSALYEFDAATRLGIYYRSSVYHAIQGRAQFQGVPAPLAGNVNFADSGIKTALTLPDTASFGLYHEISPQWAVMSDVAWTRWSAFRTLRVGFDSGRPDIAVPENWSDTWFFSLGASYKPTEQLTLNVGTAYDMSPVSDQYRTARVPDSSRLWLSGGMSYALTPDSKLSFGYAHLFAGSAPIDQTDPGAIGCRLVGKYDNQVDIVSTSVSVRF
jgi:long-chain fatty acid transport protein